MGTILAEDEYTLVDRGYRFIVVQPYLVFYRFINDTIVIHRILHGRRDYLRDMKFIKRKLKSLNTKEKYRGR